MGRILVLQGVHAVHWSSIGDVRATDAAIMRWAVEHRHAVFTHDLDFSAILATAAASGPSVIQVRTQETLPDQIGNDVVSVLIDYADAIAAGAIVTIDVLGARVRVLPIQRQLPPSR